MEIKDSLIMPKSTFEMKGNLPTKEPKILEKWKEIDLYNLVLENNKDKPYYMLHDGPPYANGDIHCGHAVNKILKDFIIRYKNMSGFKAPYVPGWDTHGLPIESVLAKKGIKRKEMNISDYRNLCKDYALSQVDRQREGFIRLGSIGEYNNPYVTLDKNYEAHQIAIFAKMALDGYVYKGKKPVYWSPSSETSLAEAEIEYYDVTSASIYVRFKVVDGKGKFNDDEYFVIWTTTPWTMPANLAICLNENLEYGVFETNKGKLIFLTCLEEQLTKELGLEDVKLLRTFKGKEAEYVKAKHPMYDRTSVVILGDHVTSDAGTGCVHTAPGHGEDDFNVGMKYGLDVLCPVDEKGFMMKEAGPELEGLFYEQSNSKVLEILDSCGALLKQTPITHSYPHDWRTKKPIIFRVTAQWFVSIEPIKKAILDQIDQVRWFTNWGNIRLSNMIRDRHDWCISRQRAWGVPLPIIYCEDGTPIIEKEVFDHYIELFKEHGSNIWYQLPETELLPAGYTNSHSPNGKFRKETDIMDVWFDSGSSSVGVLDERNLPYPADLYLEGSDQYRGWFNSSIIIGTAYKNKSPYKAVVSHGFVLDGKGNKMSKSLGNTVDPAKVCNSFGADVLRLWAASTDYTADMRIGDEILKQVGESYRKIRNTLRFLHTNLSNGNFGKFDPSKDMQEHFELVDEFVLEKLKDVTNKVLDYYDEYQFNNITTTLINFMTVELSSFYLDIAKDILYCDEYDSIRRKQVQSVLYITLDTLIRLLTPILPFTMEELYSFMDGDKLSVQLLDMAKRSKVNSKTLEDFDRMLELRKVVLKALEEARANQIIHSAQEATINLTINDELVYNLFAKLNKTEQERFFIVSKVNLTKGEGSEIANCEVLLNEGLKCVRCWNRFEELDENGLCSRCHNAFKKHEELTHE